MEDIFVVKRCNKIIIQGRREGEASHLVPVIDWYRSDGARLVSINAVGSTDEVLNRALKALGS